MADKALDLAAATADTSKLSPFDGHAVVRTTISVANAGDGLSEALAIDPQEFHHGERVVVVIDGTIDLISHRPVKDAPNLLTREHRLKASASTIVSPELVAEVLEQQAAKIAAAKIDAETEQRRAKGAYNLDDQAMLAEHEDGQHTDLRPGCPECDKEIAAKAAEASADEPPLAEPTPISGRKPRATRARKATTKTKPK